MGNGHIGIKGKGRIAFFVATSGHSGVDRLIKNIAPEVEKRGYCVEILKIKNHGPYFEKIPDGVKIVEFKTSHVYSSFFFLLNYLKYNPPDVLLTDKDRVNRIAIIAKLLSGAKTRLFVRIGTTVSVNLKNRGIIDRFIQKKSIRWLYRLADKVITPSNGSADDLSRYTGFEREKILPLPSPIVPESILMKKFNPPNHPWLKHKTCPVILGVGELCRRKDFLTLLSSFRIVLNFLDARLIILGRGKQKDLLLSFVRRWDMENKVDFPGFVRDPYLYMANADVYVHSSLWEGLSFAIVEALALGTPVVSTNCPGGHAEILQNGKYGELVPVKDPEKMARAIIDILKNPKDAEFLKQAARPYTIKQSTDAYLTSFGLPLYWNG